MPTISFEISIRDLATFMHVSPSYIHKMISEQNGEHFSEHFGEHLKGAKSIKINKLGDSKVNTLVNTLVNTSVNKSPDSASVPLHTSSLTPKEINKENIIVKENKQEVESPPPTPSTDEPRRMKRPTQEEVTAYIREKRYNIDPVQFFNFYEANGWKQGNKPLKKWQACCVTWARRDKARQKSSTGIIIHDNNDPDKYTSGKISGW